jgi:hypothetical protein
VIEMLARGATVSRIFQFSESVDFSKITAMQVFIYGLSSEFLTQKEMNEMIVFPDERKVRIYLSESETLQYYNDEKIEIQFRVHEGPKRVRTSKIIPTKMYRFLGCRNYDGSF